MTYHAERFDADAIVVGAGIIGGTCACLLAQAGLRVIVLESGTSQLSALKGKDPRIFAISISSKRILKKADVWKSIASKDIGCYRKMHVWDEQGAGEIHFDSAQICQSALGYTVPYATIVNALQERMLELENIRCLWSVVPVAIKDEGDAILVTTKGGLHFSTGLLIAADGSNSSIRKLANIQHLRYDYDQSAIVCTAMTEHSHEEVARQCFISRGPLAFLPMAGPQQSAIVWSSTKEHVEHLLSLDEAGFNFELAAAFTNELGSVTASTERVAFPLSRANARHYTKPRLALIGDSAHSIHPLSGMGANLGLLDAATLADIVLGSYARGRDFGRHSVLRRYERWRRGENRNMLYLADGFKYMFESRHGPIKWLRNAGLDMVDNMPVLKRAIMRRAVGLTGNLPAILN